MSLLLVMLATTSIGYSTEKAEGHRGGTQSDVAMKSGHHGSGHSHHMSEGKHQSIASCILKHNDELDLNDEQVAQLNSLRSAVEKQLIRDEAAMKILRIELHDLIRQDRVDLKAVDAKIEEIGDLYTKIKKNHIHAKLDAEKILTGKQLKKFRKYRESEGKEEGGGGHHMTKEGR